MKRKTLFYLILILILVLLILGFVRCCLRKIIQKPPQILEEKHSIGGKIVEIEGNKISVETSETSETGEIIKGIVKVKVTDQTEIIKLTYVQLREIGTSEEMEIPEEEMGEYILQSSLIKFEDLKIGDDIEAISEKNIRNQKEFTATKIEVSPQE